jgi:hypothetical protein
MSEAVISSEYEQSSLPSDYSTLSARLEAAVRDQQSGGAVPERIRQLTALYEQAEQAKLAILADLEANETEQELIENSLKTLKDEILQLLINGKDTSTVNHAQAVIWNARLIELQSQHVALEAERDECDEYIATNRSDMEPLMTSERIVAKALGHAALLEAELTQLPNLDNEPQAFSRRPLSGLVSQEVITPEEEVEPEEVVIPREESPIEPGADLREFMVSFTGNEATIPVEITLPPVLHPDLEVDVPAQPEVVDAPVPYQRRYGPIEPPSGLKSVLKKAGHDKANDKKARA